ncbi:MAG: hypothetical protein KGK03_07405 [Candidatus Omnitrophica bacterium]|nr:hypothetical protein [Candidatus Omnitrophota bacterium]
MGVSLLVLAGCATSSRYVGYTYHRFPPKDKNYSVSVYPQTLSAGRSYYVIGKVSVEGFVSDGVTPTRLTNDAREIARKRGADAIINAKTTTYRYYYGDSLLRFTGELIVFTPAVK